MLEFLGLEQEAIRVVLACILIGFPLGAQAGALVAYGDKQNEKAGTGKIVFLVFCILIAIVGFLIGIWPAVLLFFTFQWKYLMLAIFIGVIAGGLSFLLFRGIVLRHRRRKYMRNPIITEAVTFCKQNHVVGIQCFPDRMRFFSALEDPDYCKKDIHYEKKENSSAAESYKLRWQRPVSWTSYDHPESYLGTLSFSDRGYPNVPDLPMFASALAKKLGNYGYAEHTHSVKYDTSSFNGGTHTITHYTDFLHRDFFVYSRTAYSKSKKTWKKTHPSPKKTAPVQKPNTWE